METYRRPSVNTWWDALGGEERLTEIAKNLAGRRGETKPPRCERLEIQAELPETGFECTTREYIAFRTVHLREELYIAVSVPGEQFTPTEWEHFPCRALFERHAMDRWPYGRGENLTAEFVCFTPPGSTAAQEALGEIGDALEELWEVATWPEKERDKFSFRHARKWRKAAVRRPPYRPDPSELSGAGFAVASAPPS